MSDAFQNKNPIWYPFTQMKTAAPPIPIVRGEDAYLYDADGNRYLDAISSWWVNLHGHSHPHIAEKVSAQLKTLEHVIFAGFTHAGAEELSQRLLGHLPHQSHIFFSDNGSTAVEVALKMAIQYWYNQGKPKTKFVAFNHGYHGDTFGAMSVGHQGEFNKPFWPFLFEVLYIDPPVRGMEYHSQEQLRRLLANHDDIAAFIFEPLVQGVAGMVMHEPEGLTGLIDICHQYQILTIADEVMTGFGRTGKWFASDYLDPNPSIMCFSKGLTGGTMAMAATTCDDSIYDAFYSDDKMKTLFHGHSFTANPVACAASLASLDLLEQEECWNRIRQIETQQAEFANHIKSHPNVKSVRHLGVIFALEFQSPEETSYFNPLRDRLYQYFLKAGFLLRPLGNIIYILPPYCTTPEQLKRIHEVIVSALDTLDKL